MVEMLMKNPAVAVIGGMTMAGRIVLQWIDPVLAPVFGVAVGVPLTGYLVVSHLRLKQELRTRGWIG